MSEWIEYDGSEKQIDEIKSAKSYLVMGIDIGKECSKFISGPFVWVDTSDHIDPRIRAQSDLKEQMEASGVTNYLICQPHPYADLIKIWADTGCPVWVRLLPYGLALLSTGSYKIVSSKLNKGIYTEHTITTNTPYLDIPGAEYRLTPFED